MSQITDQVITILEQHTSGALARYRSVIEASEAQGKQSHDPPTIAISIGEHIDTAAFAVIGLLPVDVAAEEVCHYFRVALESALKAEGRLIDG